MKNLIKILDLLSPRERKQGILLFFMIMIMAFLDMLGVASILPFMAVLANPELFETNQFLRIIYLHFGFKNHQNFMFAMGLMVFAVLVFSLAFKALTTFAQLRFALMREYSIGRRLLEGYLHQPYSWFLSQHSADLGKNILSEVNNVIGNGIIPMMTLIAQSAVSIALLILLVLIDPKLAAIVGVTLGMSYALIFKIFRNNLNRIGQESIAANKGRFNTVSEAFGASKEVKFGGLEQLYIQRFSNHAHAYALHKATTSVISQLPRFALEAIAFGGMLLMVLYFIAKNSNFVQALPVISLYAFAGYRLMPALQQIYSAVTQLRFVGPSINALHSDIITLNNLKPKSGKENIIISRDITLNRIYYRYPNAPSNALCDLNLRIPARSSVGLVGSTGSGKTTAVDVILGLLEAQQGTLEVDGKPISRENIRDWQRCIGYVPQQIFLSDDTVAANIAFGLDIKDIDQAALERASKIANLHEFVINELPHRYQTTLGERGVRISGGQRQRIGIARALYHNPQVLIMDEATSALDNLTEQAVMEAVQNLGQKITIILIAHRLSTVKKCDCIFVINAGSVVSKGTFEELSHFNNLFKTMANN